MPLHTSTLQTTRLRLRTPQIDDRKNFLSLYSNKEVRQVLGGELNESQINERFDLLLQSTNPCWIVEQRSNGTFVGLVSLDPHHDGVDTEISYQVLPLFWGKGFATEALLKVLDYALNQLNLPKVVAESQIANDNSVRLLKRIGMQLEREVERFGAKQAIYALTLCNPLIGFDKSSNNFGINKDS